MLNNVVRRQETEIRIGIVEWRKNGMLNDPVNYAGAFNGTG